MLVIFLYVVAAALVVAGSAITFGPGPASIVAGLAVGLAAFDLSTEPGR